MYLTHIINHQQQPVFILVLPFEQKQLARAAGFTWNNPQPGAWATADLSRAVDAVRNNLAAITIAPDTLDFIWQNSQMTDETYSKLKAAYTEPTRKEKAAIEAAILSDAQVLAVHQALQNLAEVCDGAMSDDRAGFNRNDLEYGHSLAAAPSLSRGQAGYGKLLIEKYRHQIGDDLYSVIFPEKYASEKAAAEKKAADKAAKADAKAEKNAPKLHKKSSPCEWSGCDLQGCMLVQGRATVEGGKVVEVDAEPIQLPASPVIGHYDVATSTPVVTKPEAVVVVQSDNEATRLAQSLATCHPADFDTTVDLLRALRQIDAPKKAGSEFTNAAWAASGYKVG